MRGRAFVVLAGLAAIAAVALIGGAVFKGGSHSAARYSKFSLTDPDSKAQTPGLGPGMTWDAYMQAAEAYPAANLTPSEVANAEATFNAIAKARREERLERRRPQVGAGRPDGRRHAARRDRLLRRDEQHGEPHHRAPRRRPTAARPTAAASGPAPSGGGVWRTDNATGANPNWRQLHVGDLDQDSVGTLTLDPTDKKGKTIYLGTGEGNRCSSGCEAGVGIYKSTERRREVDEARRHVRQQRDVHVRDAGPGRVPRPRDQLDRRSTRRNANHIFVGSAQAVRGLSHVIGARRHQPRSSRARTSRGSTSRRTAAPRSPRSGTARSRIAGPQSFGVTDVGLDPSNPSIVYASAFDAGLWRRDAGAGADRLHPGFKPQFAAGAGHRPDDVRPDDEERAHADLPDRGHAARDGLVSEPLAANFWRTDRGDQPAASLLALAGAPSCAPPDRRRTRSRRRTPAGSA